MPNIANLLKSEISRVSRKEVRAETQALKKAVTAYRTEIAALKRRAHALEQHVRRLDKAGTKTAAPVEDDTSSDKRRFSAKGLASQRRRLGLSAGDCAALIGASQQSIYNWETGKARPLARHMPAIAALRTLGKRDAAAHLSAIRNAK